MIRYLQRISSQVEFSNFRLKRKNFCVWRPLQESNPNLHNRISSLVVASENIVFLKLLLKELKFRKCFKLFSTLQHNSQRGVQWTLSIHSPIQSNSKKISIHPVFVFLFCILFFKTISIPPPPPLALFLSSSLWLVEVVRPVYRGEEQEANLKKVSQTNIKKREKAFLGEKNEKILLEDERGE